MERSYLFAVMTSNIGNDAIPEKKVIFLDLLCMVLALFDVASCKSSETINKKTT